MKYVKIKVSFRYAPERLYRVLLVPENVNLLRLAQIIGESLHVEWDHLFQFRCKDTCYILDVYDDFEMGMTFSDDRSMMDHTIVALGQKAYFEYDFGDGWDFEVKIYKRLVNREEEREAILLEGKGQGIWEDSISALFSYFRGDFDEYDNSSEEDEEMLNLLPWNFENEHFRDFDAPLNIEKEQLRLDAALEEELSMYDGVSDYEFEEEGDGEKECPEDFAQLESELADIIDSLDRLDVESTVKKAIDKGMNKFRKEYSEPLATMLMLNILEEIGNQLMDKCMEYTEDLPFN